MSSFVLRRPRRVLLTVLAAATLTLPGLLGVPADAGPVPAVTSPLPVTPLRIGTWNTDLQPWSTSQPQVLDAIAATDLDVLALQGVWDGAAAAAILADPRIASRYPYSYAPPAAQSAGACSTFVPISTQEDFIRAIVADGVDTHQWVQPTTPASFGTQLLGLDLDLTEQRCYAAIVNTMQALAPSVDPLTAIDRAADTTGQRYSHGGSTGQLVLSRTPITDTSVFAPEGFLARTATVYATVRGVRMAFADWPDNVLGDVDSTYAFALQPAYAADVLATAPDVVVGTLQSGPGYQSAAHDALVQGGYTSLATAPTYCPSTTPASFGPCQVRQRDGVTLPADLSIDDVMVRSSASCGAPTTIGSAVPASDHVGLAVVCRRPFPGTGVLDSFGRPDGPLGAMWDGLTSTSFYRVTGGRLAVKVGGPVLWKPASFGAAQEAYVTLASTAPQAAAVGVLLKVQAGSVATTAGISVGYDARAKTVRVSALRVGARSWTLYPAVGASYAAGDVLGARALPDGTVEVYRNDTLLGTVTLNAGDAAAFGPRGGRIGLLDAGANGSVLDDFGGGSLG